MTNSVIQTFPIGKDTSVEIEGNNNDIKNGICVKNENGNIYKVISVAMVQCSPKNILKSTELLIEGSFKGSKIITG